MYAGKLSRASLHAGNDAPKTDTVEMDENNVKCVGKKGKLLWIEAVVSGEKLSIMLDSGATHNCIALRCVLASKYLKNLKRSEYQDSLLVDANGKPLQSLFTIDCTVTIGSPSLSISCTFVVVQDLPFSCIIGESTLLSFKSWKVSNVEKILTINEKCVVPWFHQDSVGKVDHLNLITTGKTVIPAKQSVLVNTRANGPDLLPFRPITQVGALVESNETIKDRLGIEIQPSIHLFTHQDCSQQVVVYKQLCSRTGD